MNNKLFLWNLAFENFILSQNSRSCSFFTSFFAILHKLTFVALVVVDYIEGVLGAWDVTNKTCNVHFFQFLKVGKVVIIAHVYYFYFGYGNFQPWRFNFAASIMAGEISTLKFQLCCFYFNHGNFDLEISTLPLCWSWIDHTSIQLC